MAPFDRSYATFYWSATGGLPSFRPPPKLDPLGPKTQRRHCCLAPLALVSCFTTFLLIELVKTSDIHLYYCGHLHYYSCNLHYYLGYLYSICISWTIFFWYLGYFCNIWAIRVTRWQSGQFLVHLQYMGYFSAICTIWEISTARRVCIARTMPSQDVRPSVCP